MRLEKTLRIPFPVVSSLNNSHLIISFIILCIGTSRTVETNKVIVRSTRFQLHDDGMVVWVVGDANQSICITRITAISGGRKRIFPVVIPSNLPVLGGIVTHLSNIVGIERVAHHTRMVRVCGSIESTTVCKIEVVAEFVYLHSSHVVVLSLVHTHPRVDVGIGGPSTASVALFDTEHDLLVRSWQGESKFGNGCSAGGIMNDVSVIG
mmetsp:Transcript_28277/g.46902  ORF Transcript_28277/g.46902 Transcript_28277/m.46902 type:complete len:208 (+) Transcript_28277:841-1464(+)